MPRVLVVAVVAVEELALQEEVVAVAVAVVAEEAQQPVQQV